MNWMKLSVSLFFSKSPEANLLSKLVLNDFEMDTIQIATKNLNVIYELTHIECDYDLF